MSDKKYPYCNKCGSHLLVNWSDNMKMYLCRCGSTDITTGATMSKDKNVCDSMKGNNWEFNEEVTACFDDMLKRSIPQLDVMRNLVFSLGKEFVNPGDAIVDLGCSRGDAIKPFVDYFGPANKFYAFEISDPMFQYAQTRFSPQIKDGYFHISKTDITDDTYQPKRAVTLSVLTLQFIAPSERARIVKSVYNSTKNGGVFILVEKVRDYGMFGELYNNRYIDFKLENGYSMNEIERKKMKLNNVMNPNSTMENLKMLQDAGFEPSCFWRWCNFAGFIGYKK